MEVAEETVERLGNETAWHFVAELANDWNDLQHAILAAYESGELRGSLVFADSSGLLKEVHWLQLLLLAGNYPMLYRNLRFVWELMFRAFHADTYADQHPADPNPPGRSLDDKIAWLEARERDLNWATVIEPTLRRLLPDTDHSKIRPHYRALWDKLNQCVHPSSDLRYRLVDESALLVKDAFDKRWATESLTDAAEVFDLIWLAVLTRLPRCAPLLSGPQPFRACPRARPLIERVTRGEARQ